MSLGRSRGVAERRISHPKRLEVVIREFAFAPPELSLTVGDTVMWVNKDSFVHTSTSDSTAWSSPDLSPGDRFEFVVRTPGRFAYHCAAHPVMHGTLTVRHLEQ
jgi:plastocyanin